MARPRRMQLAEWIDDGIVLATVAVLGWTTWHLGGVLGQTGAVGYPLWCGIAGVVWLRWRVIAPTGCPAGWWWPLPMLAYVAWQVREHAPLPGRAWLDGLQWGLLALAYWIGLHLAQRRRSVWGLSWGVAAITLGLVGAATYQRLVDPTWLPMGRVQGEYFLTRSSGWFGVPNTLAGWLLLVIPSGLAIALGGDRKWWIRSFAALVVLAGMTGLVMTVSRGGWLAGVAGLVIWGATRRSNRGWRRVVWPVGLVVGVGVVTAGLYLSLPAVRDRADHLIAQRGELTRAQMWTAALQLWRDNPLLGSGAGSFGVSLERHRPEGYRDAPQWAHNDYLNTLSDYGLSGGVLSFGLMGYGIWRRRRRRLEGQPLLPGAGWGLLGLALATLVDFHLKIPALGALAALIAAIWLNGGAPEPRRDAPAAAPGTWGASGLIAVGLVWFGVYAARPRLGAEGARFLGREAIERCANVDSSAAMRPAVQLAMEQLGRAVGLDPGNDQAWADLSYALVLQTYERPEEARTIGTTAEAAARRALRLSEASWEYWIRLGVALDLQGRWGDAGLAFGKGVKLAPRNHLAWYYQAYHFSLKESTVPLARTAVAISLRLDPWNPATNALLAALERR